MDSGRYEGLGADGGNGSGAGKGDGAMDTIGAGEKWTGDGALAEHSKGAIKAGDRSLAGNGAGEMKSGDEPLAANSAGVIRTGDGSLAGNGAEEMKTGDGPLAGNGAEEMKTGDGPLAANSAGVIRTGDGRFARKAVPVSEAQQRVLDAADGQRLGCELVPLREIGGRRLAQSLAATSDWPPFARSGLDGYAVRAADVAHAAPDNPAQLRVIASVAAGKLAPAPVVPGTAARIMTGASVPEGADAVVMLEQTAEASPADGTAAVLVKRAAVPGQNIAPRGEEFRLGDALARPGTVLRPGHAAVLGTFGYAEVPVHRQPRVAVFATGSELLPVEAALAPGQIRDSNSCMVAAMVEQSGAMPLLCGTLPDEPLAVAAAFARVWDSADVIVTTGGVSVGDYDVMTDLIRTVKTGEWQGMKKAAAAAQPDRQDMQAEAVNDAPTVPERQPGEAAGLQTGEMHDMPASQNPLKGEAGEQPAKEQPAKEQPADCLVLFDRVAMRPGSPTSAALLDGKLLFALSGNPGACFVGFELFVRPALLRLQGTTEALPQTVTAELLNDVSKPSPHTRYIRTKLINKKDGRLYADPLAFNKSSMMASIADSDGLAVIPSGSRGAEAGELIEVILIP
ncbi:molybdopterin molybdotransferase MoeA [Paenibacillus sp. N4]|uniref:molybdopterin molybdotransferase MoeA n=1 Tax=Paenibacillus vietnamensis TaxID=2590547 RepID=UPI0021E4FCC6|nr:molybdopterin molybdotransferase MoeA [Paenibacillus vietnamensis]MCA0757803.1 molybdopterin molybdotransferase MoeA [Paenibacillus vietnamensis]